MKCVWRDMARLRGSRDHLLSGSFSTNIVVLAKNAQESARKVALTPLQLQ